MSALAMILTATMVVPANDPHKVSEEIEQAGIDLSGEWEGTSPCESWQKIIKVDISGGQIRFHFHYKGFGVYTIPWKVIDEGKGKIRNDCQEDKPFLGIYQWRGDRVYICYGYINQPRPTNFEPGQGKRVLILHRVKSRK